MKKPQHNSFKFSPVAIAVAVVLTSQFAANVAVAGAGFGSAATLGGVAAQPQTYYANSPSGPIPVLTTAAPTGTVRADGSGLKNVATSGTLMRKFVDKLPGFGAANANLLGQYIPLAVAEKWVNPMGVATTDDYYEIAAVEFSEKMHSDLPKATKLRGYVQLETAGNAATSKHIALTYPNGTAITDTARVTAANPTGQVYAYDNPHHLGPVITASSGTAVRVKFTNYLPIGGKLFLPVDPTIPGAGLGPDNTTTYGENRAGMHLVGGQAPWVSAGSPHQWIAPAGDAAYTTSVNANGLGQYGMGKGASAQTLPDMTDPGAGSTYLYFPNDMSARFTFIQDRTSGMTRLNAYAGLEAGYVVTDPVELALINGGTLSGGALPAAVTVAAGTIPNSFATIPLIIEDKTFVPANVAQQDANWDAVKWGAPGDLWFPHVYETNQSQTLQGGVNTVGRWDYGPWFWPIFPVSSSKNALPALSFVPEAYMDTPVINGTAYPTVNVEAKAYRFRILNASNDRYVNLGLYLADTANKAPQLDQNGNPIVNAAGVQQFFTDALGQGNTEVKMVPAAPINAAGNPPGWDVVNNVQLPLPQFGTTFPWNINAEPSGPTRAWPVDGRAGGSPDPTMSGPDFVVIGNDGGLLPQGVDIPPQPVTYEQNRRSITVTNIYGYGLLLGPSERADTIVDFTNYADKTLILYNDAPAPTPFNDPRNDYYTGDPDQSGQGGAYSTLPGYGPNTRTMMQVVVGAKGAITNGGGPLNAAALAAALPAAYGASQPAPLVPEVAYNASFGTADADNYGRVASGSAAQPNLTFARSSNTLALIPGPMNLVTSGGPNTGSGTGYFSVPNVVITPTNGLGSGAAATATINATTGQVTGVTLTSAGTGYTALPNVTFVSTATVAGAVVADGGTGYVTGDQVVFSGGGGTGAAATVIASTGSPILTAPIVNNIGSGYTTNPSVSITGGSGSGATAVATIVTSGISATVTPLSGSGYTSATTAIVSPPQTAGTQAVVTPTVAFPISGVFTIAAGAGGSGYDLINNTTVVNFSAPQIQGGVPPTATATLNPADGSISGITMLTAGSGYTSAPTITVTDAGANQIDPATGLPVQGANLATVTTTLAATGSIGSIAVTPGTGYTLPPTITFTTGTGAVVNPGLVNPVGTLPGNTGTLATLTMSNAGTGYTTPPTITITDPVNLANTSAKASFGPLAVSSGTITGVTFTSHGSGYTSAPALSIGNNLAGLPSAGTGALLTANILASGTGAQATVVASTAASIPVVTKAEQELYDDYGRYNSTGGVELPYTLVGIQTTIPLNYIDAPTEVIGENEVQIWKLVDNGFWSNSIHFSMADVQLVNRVGWDGTVKAPASNEVGWKDTVRLNPLEDAIVAIKAKTPKVPFGQPRSTRLQDPTSPVGTISPPAAPAALTPGVRYASGLGFTADPNVVTQAGLNAQVPVGPIAVGTQFLTATANTAVLPGSPTGNFDNEFTWGSAILGHAENDFTRPMVFNPNVVTPAPSTLSDPLGTGTLNWTDPTPASTPLTTLANPQNEIGFNLLQAPTAYIAGVNGAGGYRVNGAFAPYLAKPANVTQYIEPAANVKPNAAAYFAYEVSGWNAAGSSISNIAIEAPPDNPTALVLTPVWAPQVTPTATDVQLTATWQDNAVNETNYIVTRTGPSIAAPVAGKVTGAVVTTTLPANLAAGSTTTTFVDPSLLVEGSYYEYDVVARNAFGDSKVLSGTVQAPNYMPLAPTNLAAGFTIVSPCPVDAVTKVAVPSQCRPDFVNLTWTDNAINEANYIVTRTGGNVAFPQVTLPANSVSYQDTTAAEGVAYTYTVAAVNASGSATASLAVTDTVVAPTIPSNVVITPSTALDANGTFVDTATLTWSDNAYTETGYQVYRDGVAIGAVQAGSALNNPMGTGTAGWKSSPVLSYVDTGLVDGTSHTWSVQAIGVTGLTKMSASTALTKLPGVVVNPPTGLVITPNRAGSSIGLQWTDMSNNETDFLVEEQVSTDGGLTFRSVANTGTLNGWTALPRIGRSAAQTAAFGPGNLVNYNRGNVPTTAGYVYNFRISARDMLPGITSDSHPYLTGQASLNLPPVPVAPVLVSPPVVTFNTATLTDRVRLTWNKITPVAGTTMSYLVFAGGVQIGVVAQPFNAAATTVTFNYNLTAAQIAAGVSFTVESRQTAIRVAGQTLFGTSVSVPSNTVTLGSAPAAPAAPATFAAVTNATTGAVTATWAAVTPPAGSTVSYVVQSVLVGGAGTTRRQTPATSGGALTIVPAGNSYTVSVAAIFTNAQGVAVEGPMSAAVTVNTWPAQSTALTNVLSATARTFNVGFNNTSTNITGFTIQRGVSATAGGAVTWTTIAVTPTKVGNVYSFSNLAPAAGFYRFRIQATSVAGTTAVATTPTVNTP